MSIDNHPSSTDHKATGWSTIPNYTIIEIHDTLYHNPEARKEKNLPGVDMKKVMEALNAEARQKRENKDKGIEKATGIPLP